MYLKIPFYGPQSFVMKRKVSQLFRQFYPQIKIRIILDNINTIGRLFKFKDRLPTVYCSRIIYSYSCGDCCATYVGKSQRHLKTRISEHRGVSVRTGQYLSKPSFSNIRNHAEIGNHMIKDENFKIVTRSSNNSDLYILENLAIHQLRPSLNDYSNSLSLEFL